MTTEMAKSASLDTLKCRVGQSGLLSKSFFQQWYEVVANRFYVYTDYQSLEKVVRGAWQKFCQVSVRTSSSKVGRSLAGGTVECV